jgi:Fe-S cluster assembly protein SufD
MFSPSLESYAALFDKGQSVTDRQKQAFDSFHTLGFPTKKMENWKYTPVHNLLKTAFSPPKLSPANDLDDFSDRVNEKHCDHPFLCLNEALAETNTMLFDLHSNQTLDVSLSSNTASVSRHMIYVEEGVQAELILNYTSLDETACFENIAMDIHLAKNANLSIIKHQALNKHSFLVEHITVHQAKNSDFYFFGFDQGALLARSDIIVNLNDLHSSCSVNGFYQTAGKQHVDHHSVIKHHAPECTSSEYFRGIVDEKSRAVFNGKILIPKDAQKSSTKQMNNNLLLSSSAEVDTKPELEIYADDVKAAHGATVGQLDEAALFYLKTRGLNDAEAKAILMTAFANDVFDTIKNNEVKQKLLVELNKEELP